MIDQPSPPSATDRGIRSPILMALVLTLAALLPLALAQLALGLPDFFGLVLAALLAVPIWAWGREQSLVTRRHLLAGTVRADGWVYRFFWTPWLQLLVAGIFAMVMALLLLAQAIWLDQAAVALLIGLGVITTILVAVMRRLANDQVRHDATDRDFCVGSLSRNPAVAWVLTFVLFLAQSLLLYFWGFPSTQDLSVQELFSQSMAEGHAVATGPWTGGIAGVVLMLQRIPLHGAQLVVPMIHDGDLRHGTWLVWLLLSGSSSVALSRLMLGSLAIADDWVIRRQQPIASAPGSRWRTPALVTALLGAMALGTVHLSRLTDSAKVPAADTPTAATTAAVLAYASSARDTCAFSAGATHNAASRKAIALLDEGQQALLQEQMKRVDQGIAHARRRAYLGIDQYLDWYFSMGGNYTLLGATLFSRFAADSAAVFQQHVTANVGDPLRSVAQQVNDRLPEDWSRMLTQVVAKLQGWASAAPCRLQVLETPEFTAQWQNSSTARLTATSGVDVHVPFALRRVIAHVGSNIATRVASSAAPEALALHAGRWAAKRGAGAVAGGAAGAGLCASGGPMAVACSLAGFTISWIATDLALLAAEEALFRGEMHHQLTRSVEASLADFRLSAQTTIAQLLRHLRATHPLPTTPDGRIVPAQI